MFSLRLNTGFKEAVKSKEPLSNQRLFLLLQLFLQIIFKRKSIQELRALQPTRTFYNILFGYPAAALKQKSIVKFDCCFNEYFEGEKIRSYFSL